MNHTTVDACPKWKMPPEAAEAWAIVFDDLAEKDRRGELLIDSDTIPPRPLPKAPPHDGDWKGR